MKKFLSPIVMMLLALVGFVPASAQNTQLYWSVGSDYVFEPQEGAYYVLEGAGRDANKFDNYLSGNTTTATPGLTAIYQFEPAGETSDGHKLWRLYWVSEGKYLQDPTSQNDPITYTESKAKAYVFTVMKAVPAELGYKDQLAQDPETDLRSYHYNAQDNACTEGCVVLCNKNVDTGVRWLEWYPGYGVMWSQYTTANIWNIFMAEPLGAYDQLCSYMGEHANAADQFVPGDKPGQVPENLIKDLQDALAAADALQSDPDQPASVYEAAIQAILNAIKACEEGMIQVSEGYYIFTNNPSAGRGNGFATIIDKGTEMHWQEFDPSAGITVDNIQSIWKVIKVEGTPNEFYLQNMKTNRYAGSQASTNSVTPTTEAPEQVYYINPYPGTDMFSLDQKGQNSQFPALHAQGDGTRIVIWESIAGASAWALTTVEEEVVAGLQKELEQVKLNEKYAALLSNAKAAYAKGFTYSADNVSHDGVFTVGDGLVTEGSKFTSNAFETSEGPNCSYDALLDNNFTTYFHSVWSSAAYASLVHHLDMELSEAIDVLVIKYAKRPTDGPGNPYKIHVYASNDTTAGNWTDQGYMYCSYPWSITMEDGSEKASQAGSSFAAFDAKYKYVRLAVEETTGMGKTNGNLYFYWSELRAYNGYYDASKSLIEAVPADVRKAFEDAVATAEGKAGSNVTQEDIDALQDAYDTFMANFPDPQIVKNLLADAKKQAEGAEEGEGYGYFEAGAKDALEAAIATIEPKVKDVMTLEEVNAVKAELEAALNAFNDKLQKPADGAYIYIYSASATEGVNQPYGKYLYVKNNGESTKGVFCWGDIDTDNMGNELNFMWQFIKVDNGYLLKNAATGSYIRTDLPAEYYEGMSYEANPVKIQTAGVGGAFNIVLSDGVYLQAYSDGASMVTWGEAVGADNCAFAFEDVTDFAGEYNYYINGNKPQIVTLATDIAGYYDTDVTLYSVLGHNENNLILKKIANDELIPAGTPFVMQPAEEVTKTQFMSSVEDLAELTQTTEGVEVNGLVGAVRATEVGAALVYMIDGVLSNTVTGDIVAANTGYFRAIPATTETGDAQIEFDAELSIPDAIQQVVVAGKNTVKGVYTISGVKVRNNSNVQGLPKGLYIVGGQKVLVK